MDRLFDLLPAAALIGIGAIGMGRAAALYRRGVRVVVIDPHRTVAEQAFDLIVVAAAALWAYLIIDFAWPPAPAWIPQPCDQRWSLGRPVAWLGALMLLASVVIYAAAVVHMGESWRMGIDRATPADGDHSNAPRLITTGIYAWSRNPIYVAFDLALFGTFAVLGHLALLLLGGLLVVLLHLQAIREERFLAQRFGGEFDQYRRRVGRYVPGI